MQLVNEQDDAATLGLHLRQHRFQPLLELAAVFGSGDERAHVKRQELLVAEAVGHVALDDAQGQAFRNRGLADARLADQHGVVLGAPRQHLDGAADLLVAADNGIELALCRGLGEVARIALQRIVALLGGRGVGGAAFAQIVYRRVEALRRDAGIDEDRCRLGAFLERQRQQQPLGGDVLVAGLLGDLLGLVENACELPRRAGLARAAAGDLGTLGEIGVDGQKCRLGITARFADETRGHALAVVEQRFQKVLGCQLLMAFTKRNGLRRLHETASAVRIHLEIHRPSLSTLVSALAARKAP